MTKDEALKLALEALMEHCGNHMLDNAGVKRHIAACNEICKALAQPEEEPVLQVDCTYGYSQCQALAIAQKKRSWVGLTEVEQDDLVAAGYDRKTLKIVERLLMGKNTCTPPHALGTP